MRGLLDLLSPRKAPRYRCSRRRVDSRSIGGNAEKMKSRYAKPSSDRKRAEAETCMFKLKKPAVVGDRGGCLGTGSGPKRSRGRTARVEKHVCRPEQALAFWGSTPAHRRHAAEHTPPDSILPHPARPITPAELHLWLLEQRVQGRSSSSADPLGCASRATRASVPVERVRRKCLS